MMTKEIIEHIRFTHSASSDTKSLTILDLLREIEFLQDQAMLGNPTATLQELEDAAIRSAYHRCGGNRMEMCRQLAIAPRTLNDRLRRLGISPREKPGSPAPKETQNAS